MRWNSSLIENITPEMRFLFRTVYSASKIYAEPVEWAAGILFYW